MRFVPSVLFVAGVALVPLSGCTRATMLWRPSYVSQVPDGTPARYRVDSHAPIVRGLAVNWMSGDPRLLTPRGDTLTIPPGTKPLTLAELRDAGPLRDATAGGAR